MTRNMTMVDYASRDRRSVAAMLRNRGDGRERTWLAFEKAHSEITDGELLQKAFSVEMKSVPERPAKRSTVTRVLMIIGFFLIIS